MKSTSMRRNETHVNGFVRDDAQRFFVDTFDLTPLRVAQRLHQGSSRLKLGFDVEVINATLGRVLDTALYNLYPGKTSSSELQNQR